MNALRVERTLTQAEFNAFAALSGDDNPIHVDAAFSAATKFGRPVAHGVFLIAGLAGLVAQLRPGTRIVAQSIRYPAPTFVDEPAMFEVASLGRGEGGERFACRVMRVADGVVTCDGELATA